MLGEFHEHDFLPVPALAQSIRIMFRPGFFMAHRSTLPDTQIDILFLSIVFSQKRP